MRTHATTPSAKAKVRIQALLREVGLKRQGGICFFYGRFIKGSRHDVCTSNETKDGHIIMQYDHLVPREKNVSFGNPDLGVVICQGLHGWKSLSDVNKKIYDEAVKLYLPAKIIKLWKRCEDDQKSYPMGEWEWNKVEILLKAELLKP